MKKKLIFLAVVLAVVSLHATDEAVFKSYPVYSSEPQSLVGVLKELLGKDAKVVYHKPQRTLLVTATEKEHETMAVVLKEINIAPRNVKVVVSFKGKGGRKESSVGVTGSGKVIVGRDGKRIKVNAEPRISSRTTTESSMTQQTLLVQSGGEGSIFVGQDVPFVRWFVETGRQWGLLGETVFAEPEIEWRSLGASLRVKPQVAKNGLITLKLTPELSGMIKDPQNRLKRNLKRIQYTTVSTEVTVRSGQSISLGGVVKNHDFYDKFLVGVDHNGNRYTMDIVLTPYIMEGKKRRR